MKITTLAKLAALGGAAYYVKKQGGFGPAFDKLKESMKGLADQAKPLVDSATGGSASIKTENKANSGVDHGKDIASAPRFGSTLGAKTSY
jgi:hypothetical protein